MQADLDREFVNAQQAIRRATSSSSIATASTSSTTTTSTTTTTTTTTIPTRAQPISRANSTSASHLPTFDLNQAFSMPNAASSASDLSSARSGHAAQAHPHQHRHRQPSNRATNRAPTANTNTAQAQPRTNQATSLDSLNINGVSRL